MGAGAGMAGLAFAVMTRTPPELLAQANELGLTMLGVPEVPKSPVLDASWYSPEPRTAGIASRNEYRAAASRV